MIVTYNDKIRFRGFVDSSPVMVSRFSGTGAKAGFPSPALDYKEDRVDLNQVLIKHPSSTFLIDVTGDSMSGAFISDPATLIMDRAIQAKHKNIVLAVLNGEFTVKFFERVKKKLYLVPANDKYQPTEIVDGMEFQIWAVCTQILIDPLQLFK